MKIQTLAVIFVLIILPISIVLSEYVQVQADTLNVQTQYDSQLLSATYDAVVAFQKNTVNSWSSTITSSKIRDIEASASVFLNSVANNFKMSGNSKDAIKEYIPAIVYTLYDGYYIYSPFYNKIDGVVDEESYSGSYGIDERTFGLKPYIYYSREYKYRGDEFVITYSLDNYITIQGKIGGNIVNDSGYLIDIDTIEILPDGIRYRGADIRSGTNDKVYEFINKDEQYPCVKVDGTKYYLDGDRVFYFVQNNKNFLSGETADNFKEKYFDNNNSAQEYYKNAYEFTHRIIDQYNLSGLLSSNGKKIFKTNNIEYYNSNFNEERRDVIKSAIEKNLSVAIANFNNITKNTTINYQMPQLADNEWDKVINNISVITFLQGLNMGSRQYNGYAIVPNNKNEESVGEDSIYIVANGEYHRVNDNDLLDPSMTLEQGIYNMDFERKGVDEIGEDGSTIARNYFYPRKETACYNSIVNQSGVDTMQKADGTEVPISIYEYLDDKIKKAEPNGKELASLYYTALGRERQGMNKIN